MDIEKIKTQMCDNYCKHFAEIRATFEDIDRGQEELDRICEHCPLNELEDAGGEYIRVADLLNVEFKNPIGLTAFRNIIKRQETVEIIPSKRDNAEPIPQWRGCMDGCLPYCDGKEVEDDKRRSD